MPRNSLPISLDKTGIITNLEASDGQDNYAVYAKNIDPLAPIGRLQPITKPGSAISTVGTLYNANNSEWIEKKDGKKILIYDDGTDIKSIEDFYGTRTAATQSSSTDMKCVQKNNQELHIGTGSSSTTKPKWIGYTPADLNNGSTVFTGSGSNDAKISLFDPNVNATETVYVKITTGAVNGSISSISTVDVQLKIVTSAAHGRATGDRIYVNLTYNVTERTGPYGEYEQHSYSYNGYYEITVINTTTLEFPDIPSSPVGGGIDESWSSDGNWSAEVTTEKFKYQLPGEGAYGHETTIIAGKVNELRSDLSITFKSSSGHVQDDIWAITINPTTRTFVCVDSDLTIRDVSVNLDISFYNSGSAFLSTKRYWYAYSFIFDGYQESPLIYNKNLSSFPITSQGTCKVILGIAKADIPARVTGFRLYRSETDKEAIEPGMFYFAEEQSSASNNIVISGANLYAFFYDDGTIGPSYEANTGIAQTVDSFNINYELSAQISGFHFVAKCYKASLPDATYMIFRSKQNRFDMFDWSNDFLVLPMVPVQMAAFQGKLYVWLPNKILRIHPDLYIEDEMTGYGIASGLKPFIDDYGMYWFDDKSIYQMQSNGQIKDIGYMIRISYDETNLKSFNNTLKSCSKPNICYSREKDVIMFSGLYSGTMYSWCFSLAKEQWYLIIHASSGPEYLIPGTEGDIYICDPTNTNVKKMFAGTDYEAFELITRKYDIGLPGQNKKFYKIKKTGNASVTYGINDATSITSSLSSEALNSVDRLAKNLQIKASGTSGSTLYYLDSLEIIFRELEGRR